MPRGRPQRCPYCHPEEQSDEGSLEERTVRGKGAPAQVVIPRSIATRDPLRSAP